jgi:hypothetical protein
VLVAVVVVHITELAVLAVLVVAVREMVWELLVQQILVVVAVRHVVILRRLRTLVDQVL